MTVFSVTALADKIRAEKTAAAKARREEQLQEQKDWAATQPWSDIRFAAWHGVANGDDLSLKLLADIDFLVNEGAMSDKDTILNWPFIASDKDKLLILVAEGRLKLAAEEADGYF